MKRKFLFATIGLLALLTYSCRKELSNLIKADTLESLSDPAVLLDSAQAKEYYKKILKPESSVKYLGPVAFSSKPNKKYVMFPKRYISETKDLSLVEVPLYYNRKLVSSLSSPGEPGNLTEGIRSASFDRLVIYKNKKTGKIDQRIVRFVPDSAYLSLKKDLSKNHVNKLDPDFSGNMFYMKWDGTPLRVLKIKNGEIKQRVHLKIKEKKSKNSAVAKGCSWFCYREWERECWIPAPEDDEDHEVCTGWVLVYEDCWEECDPDPDPDPDPEPEPCTNCGPEPNSDCTGTPNGTAHWSECGCIGGTTGITSCQDPCGEKNIIKDAAGNSVISAQNSSILSQTNSNGKEYGAERNLQSYPGGAYMNTTVRTDGNSNSFTPNFSWNATDGYNIGASHGHPGGSAPSPADAFWPLHNLNHPDLIAAGAGATQFYKDHVSITANTSNGTYVVTVQDWNALQTLYNQYSANPAAFNSNYVTVAQNNGNSTEYALLSIFGNAINLYKAPPGSNNFEPRHINGGSVANKPCP